MSTLPGLSCRPRQMPRSQARAPHAFAIMMYRKVSLQLVEKRVRVKGCNDKGRQGALVRASGSAVSSTISRIGRSESEKFSD